MMVAILIMVVMKVVMMVVKFCDIHGNMGGKSFNDSGCTFAGGSADMV